jgi:hypothetical protein
MRTLNRSIGLGVLLLTLFAMSLPTKGAINPKKFRVGYQKAANTLVLSRLMGRWKNGFGLSASKSPGRISVRDAVLPAHR